MDPNGRLLQSFRDASCWQMLPHECWTPWSSSRTTEDTSGLLE
jgi:hypothetical protein